MPDLAVLAVASEVFPLVKTGGLADVVGALPGALAAQGVAVRTLVPGYPAVLAALRAPDTALALGPMHGGPTRVLAERVGELDLLVLDAPHLFDRPGNPYLGPDGRDWPDNALRFAALSRVAAAIARGAVGGYAPAIVHVHDWQAGLVPAYLHYAGGRRPATVLTVHNLAFQGLAPRALLETIGLPPHAFAIDGVEFHGYVGFLKGGLAFADRITTVSPTYAREIRTPEAGMGLDGLLRHREHVLSGIANGIDTDLWNPATDPHLAARYRAGDLRSRARNKAALRTRLGLAPGRSVPLFGIISRLTWQKGVDLLLDALPALVATNAQFALLGSGEASLEQAFVEQARRHADRVAAVIGYDEPLAHLMQAGVDALLVPSRFEPCGLTQLCALRYGALPVVARVGGLADTVVDADAANLAAGTANGVQFAPVTREALEAALRRTLALWPNRGVWHALQASAMAADVGWGHSAAQYATLFRAAAAATTR